MPEGNFKSCYEFKNLRNVVRHFNHYLQSRAQWLHFCQVLTSRGLETVGPRLYRKTNNVQLQSLKL